MLLRRIQPRRQKGAGIDCTGAVTTKQVIACREDMMEYLLTLGVESETASEMMAGVRKGRAEVFWDPSNSSPKATRQQQIFAGLRGRGLVHRELQKDRIDSIQKRQQEKIFSAKAH